jgi:hypothetical protein
LRFPPEITAEDVPEDPARDHEVKAVAVEVKPLCPPPFGHGQRRPERVDSGSVILEMGTPDGDLIAA